MPYREVTGILTDVGTEELAHIEIVSSILYQLTRCLTPDEIKASGFDTYFVDHTAGIYPQAASGTPFSAMFFQSKGDVITDLNEDLAAEQKARTTYDNILRLTDDPDVRDVIKFLRAREIVHYQRFCEALGIATERAECKTNFYATNPSFDKSCKAPCAEPFKAEQETRIYAERSPITGISCDHRDDTYSYPKFTCDRPF